MASKVTKSILILFWTLFAAGVILVYLLFASIANGSIGYMPPVEQSTNTHHKSYQQMVKHWAAMPTAQTTASLSPIMTFPPIW
jgi:uncharacterized protein (DUF2342 family)